MGLAIKKIGGGEPRKKQTRVRGNSGKKTCGPCKPRNGKKNETKRNDRSPQLSEIQFHRAKSIKNSVDSTEGRLKKKKKFNITRFCP